MMIDITFEEQVKKIENVLLKVKELIPNERNKGEHLHYFGPHNFHLEQENVNDIITTLKTKYEKFRSINSPSTTMKLVSEKNAVAQFSNPLKMCLKNATTKIRDRAKDTTLKMAIQKLEAISIEEGLRFDCEQMNNNCFISSDMFYVEVTLDNTGIADDVKLHGHTGEPKSCKELVAILRKKDYREFRSQLKGLKSRYMLKGETFMKSKILSALETLEEDLLKIQKSDVSCNLVSDYIMRGPVGYVIPRVGGKGLQLTYCIDPLALLDTKNEGLVKVYSSEDPFSRELGYSVTLSVRSADSTLLPVISLSYYENNKLTYQNLDGCNSQELPATFVLNLENPLPTSIHIAKCLYRILNKGSSFIHYSSVNVGELIVRQHTKTEVGNDEEFTTVLPDQIHCIRCVPCADQQNPGILLSSIPFSHPVKIPLIIKLLRCQAIYNILLCSCLHKDNITEDNESTKKCLLDVSACDWNVLTVTFIHPIDESMASVDFIITPESIVDCVINVSPGSPLFCSKDYPNKVVNRCLSIPITMRSLFKQANNYKPEQQSMKAQMKKKTYPDQMKLVIPSLAQIQSGLPLMSPQLTASPSTFLNFSTTPMSPSGPLFPSADKVRSGRKRSFSNSTPGGSTPGSDGSNTPSKLKLKLKIKRKKNEDEDIYEIDKPNSDFDTLDNMARTNSLSFPIDFDSDSTLGTAQGLYPIESDTDISGLLEIPGEPFVQMNNRFSVIPQVEMMDFQTLSSASGIALDTGNVLDQTPLMTQTPFDIETDVMIDIDNLMNAVP